MPLALHIPVREDGLGLPTAFTQRKETAPESGDGTERLMTLWKTLAFPRAGMGAVRVSGGWMSPWTLFPQI